MIVVYTFVYAVNATAAAATPHTATGGVWNRGDTQRTAAWNGIPPSRANANAIRDADVTVASPHRYCATTAAANSAVASQPGTTAVSVCANAFSPSAAASSGFGIASTTAQSITHPATPDTSTDRTMPRGTASAA